MKRSTRRPQEIFLSYSHHDAALARKLVKTLRKHGVATWYSQQHVSGAEQWLDQIGAALDRCDWFVVLLTPAAVSSKWVKRELTYALDQDRYVGRIVPLLVKECDYQNLAWPLRTLQMIRFKPYAAGCKALLKLWGLSYRVG